MKEGLDESYCDEEQNEDNSTMSYVNCDLIMSYVNCKQNLS